MLCPLQAGSIMSVRHVGTSGRLADETQLVQPQCTRVPLGGHQLVLASSFSPIDLQASFAGNLRMQ